MKFIMQALNSISKGIKRIPKDHLGTYPLALLLAFIRPSGKSGNHTITSQREEWLDYSKSCLLVPILEDLHMPHTPPTPPPTFNFPHQLSLISPILHKATPTQ